MHSKKLPATDSGNDFAQGRTDVSQSGGLNSRQSEILETAKISGGVQVEPLAEVLSVTPQTIRRDLKLMCDMRLLQRVHGGAVVHDGVSNLGYEARKRFMAEEKRRIGVAAAALIPADSSLFVNIGTTTEAVVRELASKPGLLVVTNNVNAIEILRPNETATIMMAGGTVRNEDGGIVGRATAEFMAQFKMDKAVIGVSALEEDGTLLDFDQQEVGVAKAIIANARVTILVADSSKYERSAPMRIGNISEVDYLVTDVAPPKVFLEHCHSNGVEVIVAR